MTFADDDYVRYLTEYPAPDSESGLQRVRASARARQRVIADFRTCGYEQVRSITTHEHRDGSRRRIDVFRRLPDAENANIVGELTPEMFLPPHSDDRT